MKIKVKICGIARRVDALLAAELGAWAIGFVFHPKSPRCVTPEEAREIGNALPTGSALKVGVFMDQPVETILAAAKTANLDLLQLHGGEPLSHFQALDPERCIQAVSSADPAVLEAAAGHPAAYLLIDRPRTPAGPSPGMVDLALAEKLARRHSGLLLAGGLAPENAAEAIRQVRPWGVDVSSGIESAPGLKDPDRMAFFFKAVESAGGPAS